MPRIKILDRSGHTELVCEGQEALEAIKDNAPDGEWVFVDGRYHELSELRADAVSNASEVVITPALQAG